MYLISTGTCLLGDNFIGSQLRPNLGRSEVSPFSLMLQRFQLHFVRLRPFHGTDGFPLQIAVHHEDHRLVVVKIADDGRYGFQPRKVCGMEPPVSGYHLVSALRCGADDGGVENAHLHDAVDGLLHELVVRHLEGVVLEGTNL